MLDVLFIGIGGFIGAISRYQISMYTSKIFICKIPIGTLSVNILGGILISLIMGLSVKTNMISPQMKLFLTTGLMGGLTTFSTFSYETVNLMETGDFKFAFSNVLLNVLLSLVGVGIGKILI